MTPYQKKTPSYRFASFLLDHPKKAMSIGLLVILALLPGLGKLGSDFGYRIWFRETDPQLMEFDRFERQFGNDEMVVVLAHSPSGIFDSESIETLQSMTRDFWQVEEVIRVDSLANYNWTHSVDGDLVVEALFDPETSFDQEEIDRRREIALKHEVIPGYLVSPDAKVAVFYLQLKPAIGGTTAFDRVIQSTRNAVKPYEGKGDHTFYITGPSAISSAFKEVSESDLRVMVPILLGAIVLFLLFFFRSVAGVLLPMFVIVTSILGSLGFAGWLGIEFNNMLVILPNTLIAVSIADVVHLLASYYQFRGLNLSQYDAAHTALTKNLLPTVMTSLTTSIGFIAFMTGDIVPVVTLGLVAGFGTALAWFISIFVVGPMLPRLSGLRSAAKSDLDHTAAHPRMIQYTQWLSRYARPVIGVFVIATAGSTYLALQNEVNSDPLKYFDKTVHTRLANDFAEAHVGGMQAIEIVIDSGKPDGIKDPAFLAKVDAYDTWLKSLNHVTKTVSILDIIKQSNRSLNEDNQAFYTIPNDQELVAQELFLYTMGLPQGMDLNNRMTLDNQKMRLTAMSTEHKSKTMLVEIEKMEVKAKELGLDALVTGKMPLYQSMNPMVIDGFTRSNTLAFVFIFILMVMTLKDFKLGMLSMIPNVVPMFFGGALMYLMGKPLDIGTALVSSICLGIAVDDTIHFMTNYQRWLKMGLSREMAIAHVYTHTGPALLMTTTILVVGFGTFAFSSFMPNVNMGILTALILTIALVTDMILMPAILLFRPSREAQEATNPELQMAN